MNIHTTNFGLHTPPPPTYKRPHLKAYLPVNKKVHLVISTPPPPPMNISPPLVCIEMNSTFLLHFED